MCNTENIFTSYVRSIEAFCEHRITKQQLFDAFVNSVENAEIDEKDERLQYEKEISDWEKDIKENHYGPCDMPDKPYSNWFKARESLNISKK